jgi:hypothetical protein
VSGGLWLRGDLEALSDDLLARRLENLGDERDEILHSQRWERMLTFGDKPIDGSGSIRHPAYYEFTVAFLRVAVFAAALTGNQVVWLDRKTARLKVLACEIQDVMQELERRVAKRRRR